ncbi:MAG: hypothetical protein H0V17_29770 [Deltaproteobacteria bacterium]|nr:hypothetical protein [Deltaproteobacteria bacterium]
MRFFESTPTKLILGVATASLTALGIVIVASSVAPPAAPMDDTPHHKCRLPRVSPPPPPSIPQPSEPARPRPASSK